MARKFITETVIRQALAQGLKTLEVPGDAIVTLLAAEVAATGGLQVVKSSAPAGKPEMGVARPASQEPAVPEPKKVRVVAFGSDHGGFQLKQALKTHAESLGYETIDVGTNSEEPCDYPDFAYAVGMAVATGKACRGVMIDGAGIGSCVVANKIPHVRAACCHNEFVARNAREHNDTNVLTLGSRVTGSEVCKEILKIWLETPFGGGRHQKRVDKIGDVESRFLK